MKVLEVDRNIEYTKASSLITQTGKEISRQLNRNLPTGGEILNSVWVSRNKNGPFHRGGWLECPLSRQSPLRSPKRTASGYLAGHPDNGKAIPAPNMDCLPIMASIDPDF
ncbi:hypothetical protein CEXT_448221 [Caerostris extrusa]|uniref:Uncharacterized protein n=1 Tax=Caerostris extrusa TaxID=172846 RepID=A0AAV4QX63_CAEEX|nr:hypothetical protein CEXT_448221 [Caerostris extrusa]